MCPSVAGHCCSGGLVLLPLAKKKKSDILVSAEINRKTKETHMPEENLSSLRKAGKSILNLVKALLTIAAVIVLGYFLSLIHI